MNADDFISLLKDHLAGARAERTVIAQFEPGFIEGHGSVFVTFVNLPFSRFKERRGGGAESENNRSLFVVQNFPTATSPVTKVTIETLVNNIVPRDRRLHKKTAAPAKIAEYLARHIAELASIAPNYTHE